MLGLQIQNRDHITTRKIVINRSIDPGMTLRIMRLLIPAIQPYTRIVSGRKKCLAQTLQSRIPR